MKEFITSYLSALISLLIIDGTWLFIMSKRFYSVHLASLMSETPKLLPAILFYLIYILCLVVLVVLPAVKNNTQYLHVFLYGALLGLAAYGTYDLTNQSTIKDWPVIVTVVDLIWGTMLTAVIAVIATYFTKLIA